MKLKRSIMRRNSYPIINRLNIPQNNNEVSHAMTRFIINNFIDDSLPNPKHRPLMTFALCLLLSWAKLSSVVQVCPNSSFQPHPSYIFATSDLWAIRLPFGFLV